MCTILESLVYYLFSLSLSISGFNCVFSEGLFCVVPIQDGEEEEGKNYYASILGIWAYLNVCHM